MVTYYAIKITIIGSLLARHLSDTSITCYSEVVFICIIVGKMLKTVEKVHRGVVALVFRTAVFCAIVPSFQLRHVSYVVLLCVSLF